MSNLKSQDELAEWLGYDPRRPSDIKRFLNENGIEYWIAKNGNVITTTENIQQSKSNELPKVRFHAEAES